ncbi:TIGR00366 family protein [Pseudomonas sp. G.S.17]|uniref:TIGR00366 family protein n=1 Tax=Pseudomonas sp. G.S.17 TaxID=3137451 RepID=UPI00311CA08F
MAVVMGKQLSNMLQPFWAAPVVAMAGTGTGFYLRDVSGWGLCLWRFAAAFVVNRRSMMLNSHQLNIGAKIPAIFSR